MEMSDLSSRQLSNAFEVYKAASPYGVTAAKAALMCAAAESSFLRYANDGSTTRDDVPYRWRTVAALSLLFPHDAVAGSAWTTADSVGMFQQRAMYGYCTPDLAGIGALMDPAESTRIFVRGSNGGTGTTRCFLQSPENMTIAQRVQWTQGSEFPDGGNYVVLESIAGALMVAFRAVVGTATTNLPPETSPATGAGDITDWITMADQAALDAFAAQIAITNWTKQLGERTAADNLEHGPIYTAREVAALKVKSRVDGQMYDLLSFLAGMDEKQQKSLDL